MNAHTHDSIRDASKDDDDDEASLEEMLKAERAPVKTVVIQKRAIAPKIVDVPRVLQQKALFTIDNSYVIASFDIGIKNLAYCIMSYHPELQGAPFKIYDWQVVDLLSEDTKKMPCSRCAHTGNYYDAAKRFYCLRHAKTLDEGLKAGLEPSALTKHRRIDNTDNLELNIAIIRALDKNPLILKCREVIMEQQPQKNAKMKNLSFMIFSYFACRGRIDTDTPILKDIRFVNSKHKLSVYDGPVVQCDLKNAYGRNKYYGKAYCDYMIRHDPEHSKMLRDSKKRDDLADCFLQGAWYLKNRT